MLNPMNPTPSHSAETILPLRLSPGEALTIYSVEVLALDWGGAWVGNRDVEVDLSGVSTCDSLGVQLLCAVRRTAEAARTPLRFVNVPAAVVRAAAAIACEGLFFTPPQL